MKQQLVSAELKNQRLTEAFKKTSKEFREVCYQLLGYKIDMRSNNQYRLMNMYADSPEDFLLFQVRTCVQIYVLADVSSVQPIPYLVVHVLHEVRNYISRPHTYYLN